MFSYRNGLLFSSIKCTVLVQSAFLGRRSHPKLIIYMALCTSYGEVKNTCADEATLVFSVQVNAIAQGRTE